VGFFNEPYIHYNFSHGLAAWLREHVRYAADGAQLMTSLDAASESSTTIVLAAGAISRPLARFFYVFFWRRGFLDGRYGFLYALMLAVYEGMIAVFAWDFVLLKREQARQAGASRAKSPSEPQT
jgi:hypothetical protein